MDQETTERQKQEEILRKICAGVYKISEKRKGRSLIWCVFGEIQREDGTFVEDVVYCQDCHHILKFNGKQTSNLVRHKCYFKKRNELEAENYAANNAEAQEHEKGGKKYKFLGFSLKQLGPKEKQSVMEACSQWETEENRSDSTYLDSEGFQKLVHTFIRLGAKHGENIDLHDIFSGVPLKTISRQLPIKTYLSKDKTANTKQDLERSSEDDNNQTFNNENESEMEFSSCSTDPVATTFSRPLSTSLTTALEPSSDTVFNLPKRSSETPKPVHLRKVFRIDEPRRSCEELDNDVKFTPTSHNEQPKQFRQPILQPTTSPTATSGSDKATDGCTIYGDHIAYKMSQYTVRTRNIAQHYINNILFDADMGKYEENIES